MFTGDELRIWIKDKRDTFVKTTKEMKLKTGVGIKRTTAKKKWILKNFAFLKPFIESRKGSTVGVGTQTNNITSFLICMNNLCRQYVKTSVCNVC